MQILVKIAHLYILVYECGARVRFSVRVKV